ncbi:unnamed protein product [Ectocarpus sp. 4 AP-2014]
MYLPLASIFVSATFPGGTNEEVGRRVISRQAHG